MPDFLLLNLDTTTSFKLEELAKSKGFRVKSALDFGTALEWLKVKEFDLVWAQIGTPVDKQQKLADLLWKQNPLAPFVIFDLAGRESDQARSARLFGAEVARGSSALSSLEKSLENIRPRGSLKSEKFKILVVEDLDAPRDIICAYIESMGFSAVVGTSSAAEALTLLESDRGGTSCIITDIRMPQMTGDKFISSAPAARKHDKLRHLPIIVLTAYGTTDCLIDCLKAGASGFLVKPPKKHDLTRELGRACRIATQGANPRLATEEEAELLRGTLLEQGL